MEDQPRILVIEDDGDIAWLVKRRLQEAGYQVAVALDGQAGLAEFFSRGADLVLLDLKMPRIDGWEVCRRLRTVSNLPIILVTAYAGMADRIRGLSMGADDYLCKPFSTNELLARVRAVLRRQPAGCEEEASPAA